MTKVFIDSTEYYPYYLVSPRQTSSATEMDLPKELIDRLVALNKETEDVFTLIELELKRMSEAEDLRNWDMEGGISDLAERLKTFFNTYYPSEEMFKRKNLSEENIGKWNLMAHLRREFPELRG